MERELLEDISLPLITKYRPREFDQLFGQQAAVEALENSLKRASRPHSYLFTGPSGVGKTTLARILANHLNAEVVEVDAAITSGADSIRNLIEQLSYKPLLGGSTLVILDECHVLSSTAFQALLKTLEEPPEHLFFALCTTNDSKVPETVKTRCHPVALRAIGLGEIKELLEIVAELEGFLIPSDVIMAAVQASDGSARKGLANLEAVHTCRDGDSAHKVLSFLEEVDVVRDIAKMLITGRGYTWANLQKLVLDIPTAEAEAAWNALGRYLAKVCICEPNEAKSHRIWMILDLMLTPINGFDRWTQLVVAIGRVHFGMDQE